MFRLCGLLVLLLTGCGGSKAPWTNVDVIEREPKVGDLPAYPPEGKTVGVNPPGFYWTPNENARLAVRLIASAPYRFSQTDQFPIAPEPITNTAYVLTKDVLVNQWHLKATTAKSAQEMKFLAVMVPYRASEPQPGIVPFQEAGTSGFRVAGTEVAAWWGNGSHGKISAGGLTGEGRFVLKVTEDGRVSTVVAQ